MHWITPREKCAHTERLHIDCNHLVHICDVLLVEKKMWNYLGRLLRFFYTFDLLMNKQRD